LIATVGLLVALFTGIPANATTIYKSIDAHGNVTFSQTPPKDRPSQTIEATGAQSSTVEPSPTAISDGEREAAAEDRATDPSTAVKVIDREKARETCTQARKQREAIVDSGNQLMVEDEAGKYQPMSEEQRKQRLERLDAIIEEACGAAGE